MSELTKALVKVLEDIADKQFSIKGTHESVLISLANHMILVNELGEVLHEDRDVEPRERPIPAPVETPVESTLLEDPVDRKLDFGAPFSESDWPRLSSLVEITRIFPLDCAPPPFAMGKKDQFPNQLSLGSGSEKALAGNLANAVHLEEYFVNKDEWVKSRVRLFTQEDGKVAVEVTYFPLYPTDEAEAQEVYEATRLSEVISLADFVKAVEEQEEWITEGLFGHTNSYDLAFEVIPAGDEFVGEKLEDSPGEALLDTPLSVEFEGNTYQIQIWEHED